MSENEALPFVFPIASKRLISVTSTPYAPRSSVAIEAAPQEKSYACLITCASLISFQLFTFTE